MSDVASEILGVVSSMECMLLQLHRINCYYTSTLTQTHVYHGGNIHLSFLQLQISVFFQTCLFYEHPLIKTIESMNSNYHSFVSLS